MSKLKTLIASLIFLINISLVNCENDFSHLGCGNGYKMCRNGFCYNQQQKECNFIDDCGDNTDESSCPSVCDLSKYEQSSNLCGWKNDGTGSSPKFTIITPDDIKSIENNYPKIDWKGRGISDENKYFILKPTSFGNSNLPNEFKSSYYKKSNPYCKFRFFIHTNDTFTKVRVMKNATDGSDKPWSAKSLEDDDKLNKWTQVTIETIDVKVNERFYVSIKSELYSHSHVALGDLSFIDCAAQTTPPGDLGDCKERQFTCISDGKCIDGAKQCNFINDCDDGSDEVNCPKSCNFETSTCNWIDVDEFNNDDDPYGWTLPTKDGPKVDSKGLSLTNGGRYLMVAKKNSSNTAGNVDIDRNRYEQVAVLMSPQPGYITSFTKCHLEFQVYDKNDALNVTLEFVTDDGRSKSWTPIEVADVDNSGVVEGWTKMNVDIPANQRTSIWFYGMYNKDGILAIDDFNFVNCDHEPPPVTPAPVTDIPGTTDGSDVIPTIIPDISTSSSNDGGDIFPIDETTTTDPNALTDHNVIIDPHERCPPPSHECPVGDKRKCLPKSSVCNFVNECDDFSDEVGCTRTHCDFSDDLCNWNLINGWKSTTERELVSEKDSKNYNLYPKHSKDSPDERFLFLDPSLDATLYAGDANITFRDATYTKDDDKRVMRDVTSTYLHKLSSNCYISFDYYCYVSKCPLQIIVQKITEDNNGSSIFVTESSVWEPIDETIFNDANVDAKWLKGKAFLGSADEAKVTFQAEDFKIDDKILRNYVIGLDNLAFHDCVSASVTDPSFACEEDEFKCESSFECIKESSVCDFTKDCQDGSDEFDVGNANCSNRLGRCDFEDGCDFWSKEPIRSHYFLHETGINGHLLTDHTTRLPGGTYLSLRRNDRTPEDAKEVMSFLASPFLDASKSKGCQLRLWYNILDKTKRNKIIISHIYDGASIGYVKTIKTITTEDKQDFWNKLTVDMTPYNDTNFKIIIQGIVSKLGSINIDDVSLSENCYIADGEDIPTNCPNDEFMCNNGRCYTKSMRCNFYDDCGDNSDEVECPSSCSFQDNSFCGWISVGKNGRWTFNDNTTIPANNSKGLTFENGGRFIITKPYDLRVYEAEDDQVTATLKSASFANSGSKCSFNFVYFVPKSSNIVVNINNLKYKRTSTLFEYNSNDDHVDWVDVSKMLPFVGDPFEISIIGTINKSLVVNNNHVIGIDDLRFIDCASCKDDETRCSDGSGCVNNNQLCDGIFDCNDGSDEDNCNPTTGSCYFEHKIEWLDECGWSHDDYYDFNWTISRDINSFSGPRSKLRNSKYFLLANSMNRNAGSRCGIKTSVMPEIFGETNICYVTFYYYMNSDDGNIGSLRVFQESVNGGKVNEIFYKKGNQGKEWRHEKIEITKIGSKYYLVFEATIGSTDSSNIAIDRVKFSPGCDPGQELDVTTKPSGTKAVVDEDEPSPTFAIIMLALGIIAIVSVIVFVSYKFIKKHGGLPVFYWRKDGLGLLSNEIPMGLTNPIYDDQIKDLQASVGSSKSSGSRSSSSGIAGQSHQSADMIDLMMSSRSSSWKGEDGDGQQKVDVNDAIKDLEEIVLN